MPVDPAKPFDLTFHVDPAWAHLRLDQFVKVMVPSMSRTKIQKYIRAQRVEVNSQSRPANWRVREGDDICLRCNVPEEGADAGKHIPIDVLYEDDHILAINKQPGLVVHPVALHRHDTLLNALYWRYKDILPPEQEISLANRLDEHTSGVILVTKHTRAKQILQEQFEARTPQKTYLAICEGHVDPTAGDIDLPLGPALGRKDRCKIGVRHDEEGKASLTHYECVQTFIVPSLAESAPPNLHVSLVRLAPHTGRQHQLRVHMAQIGHPLLCDDRYGRADPLLLRSAEGQECRLARYALHAASLRFTHPADGRPLSLEAPLAVDMAEVVRGLQARWAVKRLTS